VIQRLGAIGWRRFRRKGAMRMRMRMRK